MVERATWESREEYQYIQEPLAENKIYNPITYFKGPSESFELKIEGKICIWEAFSLPRELSTSSKHSCFLKTTSLINEPLASS